MQLHIDGQIPVYVQLQELIRDKIQSGEYVPGSAIPSENELADMYGINRLTVRLCLRSGAASGYRFDCLR